MIIMSFFILSLLVPLFYQFGTSAQFIVILLLVLGGSAILGTVCSDGFTFSVITNAMLAFGVVASLLLVAALLYFSYRVSLPIYRSQHS